MTKASRLILLLALAVALGSTPSVFAGGALETVDVTAGTMTLPPFIDGPLVPIKWDARCIPVGYTYFDDGVNEPPAAGAEIAASFAEWNKIPTSYISMGVTSTVAAPGTPFGAFDFVNEINWDTPTGALAFSPSVALLRDTTLVAGMDIDLDGDADVDGSITVCADVDSDGDIEFPAGFYTAGTILDNDILFSNAFAWVTVPSPAFDVDIQAVAVHEFGHSHGLSHTLINQFQSESCGADSDSDSDSDSGSDSDSDSDSDSSGGAIVPPDLPGAGATMFPFIDIGDPAAQLTQRDLAQDDVSWSSFTYPEGTAASGPAALQPGDVAFDDVFGVITGEVFSGAQGGLPVAGASIQACDNKGNIVGEGFSGSSQFLVLTGPTDPADDTAGLFCCIGQGFHILDGRYQLPLPKGNYKLFVEALDGSPAAAGNISLTAIAGSIFGQLNFEEEFWRKGAKESDFEAEPGKGNKVKVKKGGVTSGIDFTTNVTARLPGALAVASVGFTGQGPGDQYAVRFPGASVSALLAGDATLHTGLFFTFVADRSVVPKFGMARLAGVELDGGGNLVIKKVLKKDKVFIGQDSDYSPFFFKGSKNLAKKVKKDLAKGRYDDLALILELPSGVFPGVSGFPPLIGLDTPAPFGNAFISVDGGATFVPVAAFDFAFDLVATP